MRLADGFGLAIIPDAITNINAAPVRIDGAEARLEPGRQRRRQIGIAGSLGVDAERIERRVRWALRDGRFQLGLDERDDALGLGPMPHERAPKVGELRGEELLAVDLPGRVGGVREGLRVEVVRSGIPCVSRRSDPSDDDLHA